MKTIVIISPDYLTAVYEESKKYSFLIHGYGSFKQAIDGLLKVNSNELMGVGYLGYSLPLVDSNERKNMEKFLQLCDLFDDKKRFVFITQIAAADLIGLAKKYKNVEFVKFDNETEVTDLLINQSLFGTILYATMTPYKLFPTSTDIAEDVSDSAGGFDCKRPVVFNKNCDLLLQKVDKLTTVEDTLENDEVFQYFSKEQNKVFQTIRKYQILKLFGKLNIVIQKNLMEIINTSIKDTEQWCFLKTLVERGL